MELSETISEDVSCQNCGQSLANRRMFRMKMGVSGVFKCFKCALRHSPMLKTSVKTSLVVGTLLVLLNHGDIFLSGNFPPQLFWKIPLTYVVPFCVASWGALTNAKR